VAFERGITIGDLIADERSRPLVMARWHFFYRAMTETTKSSPVIARECGGRDPQTIRYGANSWARMNNLPAPRAVDGRARQRRHFEKTRVLMDSAWRGETRVET
jgi:hypothetical protein